MADEPKRKIEEQLETWARQRRREAGEPFELHPANRGMLQREVSRKHERRGESEAVPASWFAGLWPKFALGVSIFAVLVVGAFILFSPGVQHPESRQLAKDYSAPAGNQDESIVPIQQNAAESELRKRTLIEEGVIADDTVSGTPFLAFEGVQQEPVQEVGKAETLGLPPSEPAETLSMRAATPLAEPASPPPTADAPAMSRAEQPVRRAQTTRAVPSTVQPQPSAPTAGRSLQPLLATGDNFERTNPTLEDADTFREAGVAGTSTATAAFTRLPSIAGQTDQIAEPVLRPNAQQFVRTGAVLRNESVSRTVLNLGALRDFELQQSATNLRVVDSDGSVYAGYLQLADDGDSREPSPGIETRQRSWDGPAAAAGREAAPSAVSQNRTQSYFFNVSGTNLSLQQPLVFSGRLLAPQSGSDGLDSFGDAPAGEAGATMAVPQNIPLHQSQISGRAILGEGNELEVEAVAKPE